jgi:hypothetical protein
MDTQGALVIDELLKLTGISLSLQIGSPADENAPDFTSGVDQPAVLAPYSRDPAPARCTPEGVARSVASTRLGWMGESIRTCSSKIASRGASAS